MQPVLYSEDVRAMFLHARCQAESPWIKRFGAQVSTFIGTRPWPCRGY